MGMGLVYKVWNGLYTLTYIYCICYHLSIGPALAGQAKKSHESSAEILGRYIPRVVSATFKAYSTIMLSVSRRKSVPIHNSLMDTIWLFNIAMENHHF